MKPPSDEFILTEAGESYQLMSQLTEAQLEAVLLICMGYTAKVCAKELGISPLSFSERIAGARQALGVETNIEAAIIAAKAGAI